MNNTEMNIEMITPKKKDYNFLLSWFDMVKYINMLISNLELFKKVVDKTASEEEIDAWNYLFYVKKKKRLTTVPRLMSEEEIMNDYTIYRSFVLDEISKCMPFIYMHTSDAKSQVLSLTSTSERVMELLRTMNKEEE